MEHMDLWVVKQLPRKQHLAAARGVDLLAVERHEVEGPGEWHHACALGIRLDRLLACHQPAQERRLVCRLTSRGAMRMQGRRDVGLPRVRARTGVGWELGYQRSG